MLSTIVEGVASASLVAMLRPGFEADVAARAARLERNRKRRRRRWRALKRASVAARALPLDELEELKAAALVEVGGEAARGALEDGEPTTVGRYLHAKARLLRERLAGRAA